MKRKFYLISPWADLMFLAQLLQAEGHEVFLSTEAPEAKDVGRGIVPLRRGVRPPDTDWIVLFDGPDHAQNGKKLRAAGYKVIGGNTSDRMLEYQRGKALALLERVGLDVPEMRRFTTFGDALKFLERQDEGSRWYFKPEGEFACALSTGGRAALLVRFLAWAKTQAELRELTGFIVQKQVTGVEVSTEGWFDGKKWVTPFNGTFEEKHLLPGPPGTRGLGPRTGCQTNLVWTYAGDEPPLPALTVLCLTDELEEAGYQGPIDINAIVDRSGAAFALEVTPRFGFDALQAFTALWEEGTIGEQLAAFAAGELDEFTLDPRPLAMTLRVSVPPHPVDPAQHPGVASGMRGWPLDPILCDYPARYLIEDVMYEDDAPVLAGRDGSVCVIVAVGEELDELRGEVLQLADDLEIPDKQYRTDDPVARAEKDWRKLRGLGLLTGPPERADVQAAGEAEDGEGEDDGGTPTSTEPALPDSYSEFI